MAVRCVFRLQVVPPMPAPTPTPPVALDHLPSRKRHLTPQETQHRMSILGGPVARRFQKSGVALLSSVSHRRTSARLNHEGI